MRNPWLDISDGDYVGHMSSPSVMQRPMLSRIIGKTRPGVHQLAIAHTQSRVCAEARWHPERRVATPVHFQSVSDANRIHGASILGVAFQLRRTWCAHRRG